MRRNPLILAGVLACVAIVIVVISGCSNASSGGSASTSGATSSASSSSSSTAASTTDYSSGTHHAEIVVKDYGTIDIELYGSVVPITVGNFARLVNEGFYDGLTFHRVISGFMIQGGDPKGNGTGGSNETIKGEFSKNGVMNPISFKRGVVGMGRTSNSYDSASSQFFIMQADNTSLDGQYAAFGRVTSGMEVVDAICANVTPTDSNGSVAKESQPVIESIRMLD